MTDEEKTEGQQPATKADLALEKWSINLTTLISTGGAVGMLIVIILGGGWYITDKAFAAGKDGAQMVIAPLVPRVVFLEQTMPFILSEQREQRTEFRAYVDRGPTAPELYRPMAPLPAPRDAGP